MKARFLLVMSLLAAYGMMPESTLAWGRIGHRVAAAMAEERLSPAARASVRALLGPGITLADASTWADEQQEIPDSGQWHFVNVPLREGRYDRRYCQSGGCIVSKIEEFRQTLLNPKAERLRKQRALKFLIHLVADLHQPLHVGNNGDKGGNSLQVRFFGEGSNLHRVWDSQVIERHTKNEQVWLWDFDFIANPRRVKEWSRGAPADWATETLQLAKKAYCLPGSESPMPNGAAIGNAYYRFALTTVQRQLAISGVRISFMLNEIYR